MKKIHLNNSKLLSLPPLVATVGFFDGVHRGHRFLIDKVKQIAKLAGKQSAVITFEQHPQQILHPNHSPTLLSTLEQKLTHIEKTGVDYCIILRFDKCLSQLSAKEFMQTILVEQLNVEKLIIGYDNRFGYNRIEGLEDYQRYGQTLGIEVIENVEMDSSKEHISSSTIRKMVEDGDIKAANKALGYTYTIEGQVVKGYHNGHKLGYPTANIDALTCPQLLPKEGVYAVKVKTSLSQIWLNGMLYIGYRPTYNGKTICIETNIFDFNEDVYKQNIKIAIIQRVREDRKFDTLSMLSQQLAKDRQQCEEILSKTRWRN